MEYNVSHIKEIAKEVIHVTTPRFEMNGEIIECQTMRINDIEYLRDKTVYLYQLENKSVVDENGNHIVISLFRGRIF